MPDYAPQNQEQCIAFNNLLNVKRYTGGQIKDVRGYPAIVWFNPTHKFILFYYTKDHKYVLQSYARTAQATRSQVLRTKFKEEVWHWHDHTFGG